MACAMVNDLLRYGSMLLRGSSTLRSKLRREFPLRYAAKWAIFVTELTKPHPRVQRRGIAAFSHESSLVHENPDALKELAIILLAVSA